MLCNYFLPLCSFHRPRLYLLRPSGKDHTGSHKETSNREEHHEIAGLFFPGRGKNWQFLFEPWGPEKNVESLVFYSSQLLNCWQLWSSHRQSWSVLNHTHEIVIENPWVVPGTGTDMAFDFCFADLWPWNCGVYSPIHWGMKHPKSFWNMVSDDVAHVAGFSIHGG